MTWAWALLLLAARVAGGRAETRVVIEDFSTKVGATGLWTDTGEVLGLPESIQPSVGTIHLTNESDALRVDYDVAFTALWGPVTFGRTLNGTTYDQCANATHVSLKYKVKEPQSRPHLGSLMFVLLDGSDCSGPVCAQDKGQALEMWMHFDAFALDDTSDERRELRVGLCGESGTTRTPFFNADGLYANGNDKLDPGSLQGFFLGVMTPSDRPGEETRGSLLIDEIACIEEAGADPCAEPANRTGIALSEVQFVPSAASEVHEWGHQQCDELCAASETCLYYMIYGGLDALALRFPTCYLFDAIFDVLPASAVEFETIEMSEVSESDPLWKKALPDMAPATNNSTQAHHLQVAALKSSLSAVDSGSSRTMRLRRSLSTVVRSNPSSPRQKPFQTHSSLASANGRPRNLASSSSFWANQPRAQQRPALSRENTWRTSAPRLATEDSKQDLNV